MPSSCPPLPAAKDINQGQFLDYIVLYEPLLQHLSKKHRSTPNFTPSPPDDLCELDHLRFNALPAIVRDRQKAHGNTWLSKEELQQAMAWKLAHGKFRPTLPSLISSNPAQTVTKTTKAAFDMYQEIVDGSHEPVLGVLKKLAELRGVGPATASLLLSIYKPANMPFLSDEAWRWVCWDEAEGWAKKIRYTLIEWSQLCLAAEDLCERLEVTAADVEKVAYVIGRFAVNDGLEQEVRTLAAQARKVIDCLVCGKNMGEHVGCVEGASKVEKGGVVLGGNDPALVVEKSKGKKRKAATAGRNGTLEQEAEVSKDEEDTAVKTAKMNAAAKASGSSHQRMRMEGRTSATRKTEDSKLHPEPVSKRTRKR